MLAILWQDMNKLNGDGTLVLLLQGFTTFTGWSLGHGRHSQPRSWICDVITSAPTYLITLLRIRALCLADITQAECNWRRQIS